MGDDEMLRTREAAAVLRMSTKTLARLRSTEDGPPYVNVGQVGAARPTIRYRRSALTEWATSREVRGGAA